MGDHAPSYIFVLFLISKLLQIPFRASDAMIKGEFIQIFHIVGKIVIVTHSYYLNIIVLFHTIYKSTHFFHGGGDCQGQWPNRTPNPKPLTAILNNPITPGSKKNTASGQMKYMEASRHHRSYLQSRKFCEAFFSHTAIGPGQAPHRTWRFNATAWRRRCGAGRRSTVQPPCRRCPTLSGTRLSPGPSLPAAHGPTCERRG